MEYSFINKASDVLTVWIYVHL